MSLPDAGAFQLRLLRAADFEGSGGAVALWFETGSWGCGGESGEEGEEEEEGCGVHFRGGVGLGWFGFLGGFESGGVV